MLLRENGLAPLRAQHRPAPVPRSAPPPAPPDPRSILTSIGGVVYDWDIGADRLSYSANCCEVLGLPDIEAISTGEQFDDRMTQEGGATRHDAIFKSMAEDGGDGVAYRVVYGLHVSEAVTRTIDDSGRWFAGSDGHPCRAHGIIRVLTGAAPGTDAQINDTGGDGLAGVSGRSQLMRHLEAMYERAQRNQSIFAAVAASIDNLGLINRQHGYDVADELIAGFARLLQNNLRATDFVARQSGNRFIAVLDLCDSEQMVIAARRVTEAISVTPIATSAGPLTASVRFGGAVAPRQARGAQALLQRAEEALDQARETTGARFVAYAPSLVREEARLRTLSLSDEIVTALNERRIVLAYQPIVRASDGATAFHEALMRIRTGDGGLSTPGSILPAAEKIGLAHLIDQRVLELALDRLAQDPQAKLSINISAASINDVEWPTQLANALAARPGGAQRLTIEITETLAIADIEATRRLIGAMKRLGLKVAMDDFGAGHTSFRNLRALDVDHLKIDGAFIQNLSRSSDDRFFVRTLVDLARHLGIETVAEWVEDAEAARMLTDWGVTYLQGHYFGRAEVPETVEALMPARAVA